MQRYAVYSLPPNFWDKQPSFVTNSNKKLNRRITVQPFENKQIVIALLLLCHNLVYQEHVNRARQNFMHKHYECRFADKIAQLWLPIFGNLKY